MSHDPYQFGALLIRDEPSNPHAWRLKGACRQEDPELFFPRERNELAQAPAKSVCLECPVIERCRSHAMTHEESGVWGGLSESDRRRIKKRYSERELQLLFGRTG